MTLSSRLAARAADGCPIRVGLIGAGKFGTMFLAQARTTPGIHVAAVTDLLPETAPTALATAQWPPLKAIARSLADALETGGTWVTTEPLALLAEPGLEVIIEATGNPLSGIRHAMAAIKAGIHVIMVTVEADALAGPLLARMAAERGTIYSLAYGDQPSLICELVDWARTCGFDIAAAGKGTRFRPGFHRSTPDDVWTHLGISPERARANALNPRMFTAQLDGTKSAVEMAAVCNATGLQPPPAGLDFPPCGSHDLANMMKPRADGGILEGMGQVEVISSLERDGRHVIGDLRWGVFVTFRPQGYYAAGCLTEYGAATDDSGGYAAMWRPSHLVGLEAGMSVANVVLRGEATGAARDFVADVVAIAKRDLDPGEELDGEGGFTVWGKLLPAAAAVSAGALPIGLSHGRRLLRPVAAGQVVTRADVDWDETDEMVVLRKRMEKDFLGI